MTLSPARANRTAVWRVSTSDYSVQTSVIRDDCKTVLAGDYFPIVGSAHIKTVKGRPTDGLLGTHNADLVGNRRRICVVRRHPFGPGAGLKPTRAADTGIYAVIVVGNVNRDVTAGRDRQLASPRRRHGAGPGSNTTDPTGYGRLHGARLTFQSPPGMGSIPAALDGRAADTGAPIFERAAGGKPGGTSHCGMHASWTDPFRLETGRARHYCFAHHPCL